jgi:hypothetical protein
MGLDGLEIRHALGEDSAPVSVTAELKVAFDHIF